MRTLLLATIGVLALGVTTVSGQGGTVRYIYDELGRLIGVINSNGDAATYEYDAVGNLLAISRSGGNQVTLIEFTPNQSPVGATVTIFGTGYSATPNQNTVTFNGVSATVTSATANSLTVTVPPGATSGILSVTTPNGNAASATSFLVSVPAGPAITSISPTLALPGAALTVTGTNFDTAAAKNTLNLNIAYANVGAATSTQISTTVPPNGTSGRISLTTPLGSAVSSQDLFVPPAPYGVADVLVADRLTFGVDEVVSMSTANKIGLLLFDLAAGERASLKLSSVSIPLFVTAFRDPYNRTARSVTLGSGGGFLDTIDAQTGGTYTVLVDPSSSYTGNVTLKLYDVPPDSSGTIAPGGSAVTVTTSVPGQNGRRTFSGTAGQRVSLRTTGTLHSASVSILGPTGTSLGSTSSGFFLDTITLSAAGQHAVFVDPEGADVDPVTLTLYDVPADATAAMSIGGSSVQVPMTTPGQNGSVTFSGAAGQRVSVSIGPGGIMSGTATIRNPDQTVLTTSSFGLFASIIEPFVLPSTGTYTMFLDPLGAEAGTVTLTGHDVPADVTGTITPGGAAESVVTTAPGQNGSLTFTAAANQRVSLKVVAGPAGFIRLRRPDGTTLQSMSVGFGTSFMDTQTLPVTGTYSILVDPQNANTGTYTLTLYDVPVDVSGSVTVGGAALPVTIGVPGQNGAITLAGTASQQVTVSVTGNTVGIVTVALRRPDGSTQTSTISSSASFNLSTQTLATTGTYTIFIDAFQTNTGSLNISVTSP